MAKRLPDVDQALPYSPFSSIIPFTADIIPDPSTTIRSCPKSFHTRSEYSAAHQYILGLAHEASQESISSVTGQLLPLFSPDNITEFKFKDPITKGARPREVRGDPSSLAGRYPQTLTALSKSLLECIQTPYESCPSDLGKDVPDSKKVRLQSILSADAGSHVWHGVRTHQKEQVVIANGHDSIAEASVPCTADIMINDNTGQELCAKSENDIESGWHPEKSIEPELPQTHTIEQAEPLLILRRDSSFAEPVPSVTPSISSQPKAVSQPLVVIPSVSESRHDVRYVDYEGTPTCESATDRLSNSGFDESQYVRATINAPQNLVVNFEKLIQDVHDNYSDSHAISDSFLEIDSLNGNSRIMAPAVQLRLERHLTKLVETAAIEDVSCEHIQLMQSLCEHTLDAALALDTLSLSIDSCTQTESWSGNLSTIDASLHCAAMILQSMTCARPDNQLIAEELLQKILDVLKAAIGSFVMPLVVAREQSSNKLLKQPIFNHKKAVSQILHEAEKALILFVNLLKRGHVAEAIINTAETFGIDMIFVESAANEKESMVGIQKYEPLRKSAIYLITTIFRYYIGQRDSLLREILSSVHKLPTSKQAARHFKLADGPYIQPITALITNLVQVSAAEPNTAYGAGSLNETCDAAEPVLDQYTSSANQGNARDIAVLQEDDKTSPLYRLRGLAGTTTAATVKTAFYIIGYLLQRANSSTKTGDQPHRQLLDMIVEDLLVLLSFPEWPGSELLLRVLCSQAITMAEDTKVAAVNKNMALELIGNMGSAILDLIANTGSSMKVLEQQNSEYSGYLAQLFSDYTQETFEQSELSISSGIFHLVYSWLESNISIDQQAETARVYILSQWARHASSNITDLSTVNILLLEKIIHLHKEHESADATLDEVVTQAQCRAAHALCILNLDFCRRFDHMLKVLIDAISSEQSTLRSRGLRSVTLLLDKDPSIFQRHVSVRSMIRKAAMDNSPMVRDAALLLIGRCISLTDGLEAEFLQQILLNCDDAAISVRKRSIKLLKDISVRTTNQDTQSAIGAMIIKQTQDHDTAMADLAKQTIEDLLLQPLRQVISLPDAGTRSILLFQQHVSLLIGIIKKEPAISVSLVAMLRENLSQRSKHQSENLVVCKRMVAVAFEMIVDKMSADRLGDRHDVLEACSNFARASPLLFSSSQLQLLQPYIASVSDASDLDICRPTLLIYRCVLPDLSNVEQPFLRSLQSDLLKTISKLRKTELEEAAQCLWIIRTKLDDAEPTYKLIVAVLRQLHALIMPHNAPIKESGNDRSLRIKKYLLIAGQFGKHCDFGDQCEKFRIACPWYSGATVAEFIIRSIQPFTRAVETINIRYTAFDAIGNICQAWPDQFTTQETSQALGTILTSEDTQCQIAVLSSFRDFLAGADSAGMLHESVPEVIPASHHQRLGNSMTASRRDSASALISQHFLKATIAIALASQDELGLVATQVIARVNRQGLAHPRESASALVALGTSENTAIRDVASKEHRVLHQQHESMFEREYMRAIPEAFKYQKDVVHNVQGYKSSPPTAKLSIMWDIIKSSKSKYQKKFLQNYVSKIDFDITTLNTSERPPTALQYAIFLIENLAFFEFDRLEELLFAISRIDRIISSTGTAVAHLIATEIYQKTESENLGIGHDAKTVAMPPSEVKYPHTSHEEATEGLITSEDMIIDHQGADSHRLHHLASAAVILLSLSDSRSYLQRLYGLTSSMIRRDSKARNANKDLSKAASRISGVSGEIFVKAVTSHVDALNDAQAMLDRCNRLVDSIARDVDATVISDGDGDEDDRPCTPDFDEDEGKEISSDKVPRSAKRKSSASASGTPLKKRGRAPLKRSKSDLKDMDEDADWI